MISDIQNSESRANTPESALDEENWECKWQTYTLTSNI